MQIELERLRKDTPGCRERIHLNNAGASLTPEPVQRAVLDHLALEQEVGPYEAERLESDKLDAVYHSLAALVGASPEEIAVTQNATRAWDMLFYGLPLAPGDTILTCRAEYASNYIAFLQRARQTGCRIVVLDNDPDGAVCPDSLRRHLDDRVKLVAINHIPTNSGLVQPAAELGRIVKEHPAFYLLDGCQSAGQLPVDVKEIGCDAFTATSRKYLRGPRGVGFLYIDRRHIESFEPPFLDLHAATWEAPDRYAVRADARRFETYELFVAGKLGLGAAAEYALKVGVKEGWERLSALAESARDGLRAIPGVAVRDLGSVRGGIVTFTVEGLSPTRLRERLYADGVNIWTSTVRSARLDMEARDLEEVARASFHYYNSETEVTEFVELVRKLSRP